MSESERVDAHQHFWRVDRGDYGWLDDAPDLLNRDYMPDDLVPQLRTAGVSSTIVVQAAPTVAETGFLLSLAEQSDAVKGVVGWVDLADPECPAELERLAASPAFKGVRPMLQDLDNPAWLLEAGRPEAFRTLGDLGLTFDALVTARQLPTLLEFIGRYPDLPVMLNHAAKPHIAGEPSATWLAAMRKLAQSPNVYCKFSGLVTEVDGEISREALQPYVDALIDAFAPGRMVWGSDWPVSTTRLSYLEWLSLSEALVDTLSAEDRRAIYGGNARDFYHLDEHQ